MRIPAVTRRGGLRARLMWALGCYALALVALYTLYAVAFAYTVEDLFLDRELRERALELREFHDLQGDWPASPGPGLSLHASAAELPAEIQRLLAVEPRRNEFSGTAGRHYHLHRFAHAGRDWWLLAEVSERLVFRQMRGTVLQILGWSALAALGGGLLLAALVARGTTQRLVALRDQVGQLDPDALPRRLPPPTGADDAELAILRRGLDVLLDRIADSLEREQSFTRDVSHELRTPLAVIVASTEALADAESPAASRAAALARLQTASTQLSQTLDALLELARVAPAAEADGIPLLAAIERAIVEQAARRPREDLELALDVPATLRVGLRPALLRILLANLLGNAFAHAAPGPLTIHVEYDRCIIRNRAPAGLACSETGAGLGLGLSILRRLDERYRLGLSISAEDGWVSAGFALRTRRPSA